MEYLLSKTFRDGDFLIKSNTPKFRDLNKENFSSRFNGKINNDAFLGFYIFEVQIDSKRMICKNEKNIIIPVSIPFCRWFLLQEHYSQLQAVSTVIHTVNFNNKFSGKHKKLLFHVNNLKNNHALYRNTKKEYGIILCVYTF